MASAEVYEPGLEPAQEAPDNLLSEVLKEELSQAIKERGYAIIQMPKRTRDAMGRLRASQSQFMSGSRDNIQSYSSCHHINTHGISEVEKLKYYFQARSGGDGSELPFPNESENGSTDFGIDICDVYTQLDLLGRACLMELGPALKISTSEILRLLDPLGVPHAAKKAPNIEKLTREEILDLDYKSHRRGKHVWSELFIPNYISSSNLDLFYYHNIEETRMQWALNHPSHTDSGIISFIPVSTIPALDFFDQKLNHWIEIEKVIHKQAEAAGNSYKDYLIAMAGDTLEWLAKNSFKAGLHRVVRTDIPRESAVYKLRARPEMVGPKYEVDYKVILTQRKALGLS